MGGGVGGEIGGLGLGGLHFRAISPLFVRHLAELLRTSQHLGNSQKLSSFSKAQTLYSMIASRKGTRKRKDFGRRLVVGWGTKGGSRRKGMKIPFVPLPSSPHFHFPSCLLNSNSLDSQTPQTPELRAPELRASNSSCLRRRIEEENS